MNTLLTAVFDIVSFASVLVLVVLGLGVIASLMGIFNFAHGEFVLLGGYILFLVQRAGYPSWLGILLAPVVVGLLGWGVERLVVRRFYDEPVGAMLATFALGLIIRESVRYALGGNYFQVAEPISGSYVLGSLHFSTWRIFLIGAAIAIVAASWLLLRCTRLGLLVRATLENPSLTRASGFSTASFYTAAFVFGSALAGLAGALIVPSFSLFADLGTRFLIQGFISVLTGGIGTFEGPLAGAFAVGGLSAGLPWLISPVLSDVLVFVLAILFVKFRSDGLLVIKRK
ncbi:branched-chain amino acid transport system / permease component family protein [Paraburkholderia xenovorans LB400]|uniref:Amino acid/amide ABC transporter membrane protein 1, HAAT family n=1 Tax=Paraburkholderia xenovorans (strain LB400) TaxID=266265 RepID=Q13FM3_PARXL|nr:branched-chain amino acid ABC transporter permease [Paraburkholderia xenovorans]ABE37116.1 amino acid/amide ABC transporter membrane protein 1, HAAT family [Paraburkholderia xenovorans LB400]AIP34436.1 branched-chain amino acid transport system / permease component family protein [Paraburkholderia xenovorans LB400]